MHFQRVKLKYQFIIDICLSYLIWRHFHSSPSWTQFWSFDLEISFVSKLALWYGFLLCFHLFWERVLPRKDIAVRSAIQGGLILKQRCSIVFPYFLRDFHDIGIMRAHADIHQGLRSTTPEIGTLLRVGNYHGISL